MKLGISMVIKNEEDNLQKFLLKNYDLFDDVVVVDTGSTDNSINLLKDAGIKAISYVFTNKDQRLIEARNYSLKQNSCDRVLILDGDEDISREDITAIKNFQFDDGASGYFIKWQDYRYTTPFEDYKMALINRLKVNFLFSVHACPQVYIRDNNDTGSWLNGVTIKHYQQPKEYRQQYVTQLENGITENPGCIRFYRFLGYYYFKHKNYELGKENLLLAAQSKSLRFPVETLNAFMILSHIVQTEGRFMETYRLITEALDFFDCVSHDFEVKINFRLKNWFLVNQQNLLQDPKADIIPYEFAF